MLAQLVSAHALAMARPAARLRRATAGGTSASTSSACSSTCCCRRRSGGDVVRAVYLNAGSGRPDGRAPERAARPAQRPARAAGRRVRAAAVVCPVPLPAGCLAVGGAALAAVVGLALSPVVRSTGCLRPARVLAEARPASATVASQLRDALAVYRRQPRLIARRRCCRWSCRRRASCRSALVGSAIGAGRAVGRLRRGAPMVALLTLLPVSLNGMGVREGGMVLFLAPARRAGRARP